MLSGVSILVGVGQLTLPHSCLRSLGLFPKCWKSFQRYQLGSKSPRGQPVIKEPCELLLYAKYDPSFEQAQLVEGVPARRSDGRLFEKEDYEKVVRETRVEDSIIADDINV